jgi:hypothetical protein
MPPDFAYPHACQRALRARTHASQVATVTHADERQGWCRRGAAAKQEGFAANPKLNQAHPSPPPMQGRGWGGGGRGKLAGILVDYYSDAEEEEQA